MSRSRPPLLAALASAALASCSGAPAPDGTTAAEAARAGDPVLVIGAGAAGLAAAIEAAAGGAQVIVVDGASVFGGGALPTDGALALIGTPEQEAAGIRDTPERAESDLLRWGEDADPTMVRRFARESRAQVRDWLGAFSRSGTELSWSGEQLVPVAASIEPVASPSLSERVRVAAPSGAAVVVRDAGGVLDSARAAGGGADGGARAGATATRGRAGDFGAPGVRGLTNGEDDESGCDAEAAVPGVP